MSQYPGVTGGPKRHKKRSLFSHKGGLKEVPTTTTTEAASSAGSVYQPPSSKTTGVGIAGGALEESYERPKFPSAESVPKSIYYDPRPDEPYEIVEGPGPFKETEKEAFTSFGSFHTPGLPSPSPPAKQKHKHKTYGAMPQYSTKTTAPPPPPPAPAPPVEYKRGPTIGPPLSEELRQQVNLREKMRLWNRDLQEMKLSRQEAIGLETQGLKHDLEMRELQEARDRYFKRKAAKYAAEDPTYGTHSKEVEEARAKQLQPHLFDPEEEGYNIVEGEGPNPSDANWEIIPLSPPKEEKGHQYQPPSWGFEEEAGIPAEFDVTKSAGYLANMNRVKMGKAIGGAAAGAALAGLAAYGIHKAYKAYKRRKTSGVSAGGGDDGSGGGGPLGHLGSALQNAKEGGIAQEPTAFPPGGGMSSLEGHGLPAIQDVKIPPKPTVDAGNYPGGPSQEPAAQPAPHPPAAGVGGESAPPIVNAIDENWNSIKKEATGPNTDRTDPITPATGSKQTTETANSVVSAENLRNAAESAGPEAVHGTARQRANMGKGALDSWSFNGPYDYPTYPGGRPDDTMTLMGAWRTSKGGHDSSLWYSKKTAKGADAKRNKYYKWSAKNGGNWRKLSKDEMVNVFQKASRYEGGNFYGVGGGIKFKDLIEKQLQNKDRDYKEGKVGASVMQNQKIGFAPGQRKRKRGIKDINTVDYSAHN